MRRGLGYGRGKGYYNIVPIDHHIHSLSARGIKSKLYAMKRADLTKSEEIYTDCPYCGQLICSKGCAGDYEGELFSGEKVKCLSCNKKFKLNAKKSQNVFYCPKCEEEVEFNEEEQGKGYGSDPADTDIVYVCPKCDYVIDNEYLSQRAEDKRAEQEMEERQERKHKLNAKLDFKLPTVQILSAKQFDTKFKDDYEEWEQGYATTKIAPDGTTKIYVRDDGNTDYGKEGKLLMHELKEIEIFKDLINNKGIDPNVADEMAHNMNPVKIEGVSDSYPINPHN